MKQMQMAKVICFGTYRVLRKTYDGGGFDYVVTLKDFQGERVMEHFATYADALGYVLRIVELKEAMREAQR